MRFLLLWNYEILSVQFQDVDDVQGRIRLTLLAHAMIRIWDLQGVEALGTLAHNLRQSLVITSTILETDVLDLLVWVLFLGGLASQGLNGHEWWVYKLVDAAVRMSATKWHSLLKVSEGCCLLYRTTDIPVKGLWNDTLELMGRP